MNPVYSSQGVRIGQMLGQVAKLLPATLAGLGATVAIVPEANATIIHSTASNLAVPNDLNGLYINVVSGASAGNTVAGWDINPFTQSGNSLNWFVGSSGTRMAFYTGLPNAVGNLDIGNVVGPSASFAANNNILSSVFGASAGQWDLNATNYFGFQFTGDDSLLHYAWGSMIVGANSGVRSIGDIYYESATNTAITVGDTGSTPPGTVPEPTTSLLLAAGAAGLMAFRRRRAH